MKKASQTNYRTWKWVWKLNCKVWYNVWLICHDFASFNLGNIFWSNVHTLIYITRYSRFNKLYVVCRIFLHFMSSLINNKKTNSESVSTPKIGVLNVGFALKLRIYRSLKSVICLKWIRSFRSFRQHCVLSSTTYLAPLMSICFKGGLMDKRGSTYFLMDCVCRNIKDIFCTKPFVLS